MGTSTDRNVSGKGKYPETLEELAKQYWRHAVQDRGVLEETAQAEQLYLRRFFDWFGPPGFADPAVCGHQSRSAEVPQPMLPAAALLTFP